MKAAFFALLLIGVILLSGCQNLAGGVEGAACSAASGENQDHCYKDAALRGNDVHQCDAIRSTDDSGQYDNPKAQCYNDLAYQTGNATICNGITGQSFTSATKMECLQAVAIKTHDPSLCNEIEGSVSRGGAMMQASKEFCLEQVSGSAQPSETSSPGASENPAASPSTNPACDKAYDACMAGVWSLSDPAAATCRHNLEVCRNGGTAQASVGASVQASTTPAGNCRFDTDCGSICEGNTMWKLGCDAQTNTCKKTFDNPCSNQATTSSSYSFPFTCQVTSEKQAACVKDDTAISAEIQKTEDGLKVLNAQSQQANALFLKADKNCLAGLSDVTNALIVGAAKDIGFPITSMADALTTYFEQDFNYALSNSFSQYTPSMAPEDFNKVNCGLENTLKTKIMPGIQKKQDEYQQKLKDLAQAKNE